MSPLGDCEDDVGNLLGLEKLNTASNWDLCADMVTSSISSEDFRGSFDTNFKPFDTDFVEDAKPSSNRRISSLCSSFLLVQLQVRLLNLYKVIQHLLWQLQHVQLWTLTFELSLA